MPKVGDRVIIEGSKVGQQRREGSLVGITGRLLNVRWSDGTTSLLTPGAGSVRFEPKGANGSGAPKPAKKQPAKAASRSAKGATAKTAKTAKPKAAKKKKG